MPRPTTRWWRRVPAPLGLAVMSPVLAEILSGNMPPNRFFAPPAFVFLLIAYGVPVLLIRDAWVRFRLGVPGLLLLGVAYGFVNEALFARTVFLDVDVPIDAFDGYRTVVNLPWAAFIVPWHMLHAVVYPIAFAWALWPAARDRPWLGGRMSWGLGIFALAIGCLVHLLAKEGEPGSPGTLALSIAMIAVPVALAFVVPRVPALLSATATATATARGRRVWPLGVAAALTVVVASALAHAACPGRVVVLVGLAWLGGVLWLLGRAGDYGAPAFLRFALVNELAFTALGFLASLATGRVASALGQAPLVVVFAVALWRLRRPGDNGEPAVTAAPTGTGTGA